MAAVRRASVKEREGEGRRKEWASILGNSMSLKRGESVDSAQILTSPLIATKASETPVIFMPQCEGGWRCDVISGKLKARWSPTFLMGVWLAWVVWKTKTSKAKILLKCIFIFTWYTINEYRSFSGRCSNMELFLLSRILINFDSDLKAGITWKKHEATAAEWNVPWDVSPLKEPQSFDWSKRLKTFLLSVKLMLNRRCGQSSDVKHSAAEP